MNRKEYLNKLKEEGNNPKNFEYNGFDVRIFRNSKQRWCGSVTLPEEYLLALFPNGNIDIDFYQPKESRARISKITETENYPYRIVVWIDTNCVNACCPDNFNIPHLSETDSDENLTTNSEYISKEMCSELIKEYIDKLIK